MGSQTIRSAVIGHPVAHSRSPLIHRTWLQTHGIDGSYEPIDLEPGAVAPFFAGLIGAGLAGCNVTLPHKEAAYGAVQDLTDVAIAIGAVNTVWVEGGKLCGTNTDAYGFAANLDEWAAGWDNGEVATVIGAGGAARAVVYALKSRGFTRICIVNRTKARADALADRFGPAVSAMNWDTMGNALQGADLIVNTTSLGMGGGDDFAFDLSNAPNHAIATDIVYVPLETAFLKTARRRGLKSVDGLGMLLHQAVPGFELWFGVRPRVTMDLRNLIIADMESAA